MPGNLACVLVAIKLYVCSAVVHFPVKEPTKQQKLGAHVITCSDSTQYISVFLSQFGQRDDSAKRLTGSLSDTSVGTLGTRLAAPYYLLVAPSPTWSAYELCDFES